MKRNKRNKGAIWDYLEASGVLENGTDEEIKAVKKKYRKEYFLKYKKSQRSVKPEFIINLSKSNGEFSRIKRAAEKHKKSMSAFVKEAALAYLDKTYLVPNTDQIAMLEQILSQCLNEIQKLVGTKERYPWAREEKFDAIENRIEILESQIGQVFRHPPFLSHDSQTQII